LYICQFRHELARPQGLYDPQHEHDACGVGFVANIKGKKSHTIVEQGLTVLRNLTHRGRGGLRPEALRRRGLLIQIPAPLLPRRDGEAGGEAAARGQYGVGMVFLPRDPASRIACEYEIERAIKDEGQVLLGWRDVPVDSSDLADGGEKLEPVIRQVFIGRGRGVTVTDALERKLYIIRKSSGHAIQALKLQHAKAFYVPSMSARTICYKGMLLAYQVGEYYLELKDARVESALALVHQRFSTNTFPSWDLAHPFRMICHNGEINTLRGNVNWIRRAQGAISSPILGKDLDKIWPLIYDGQSDSASFDNALELLVMGGYSVAHAMMMMIPEAWENHTLMDPARRAVLRVPRGDDGAVGRPGFDRLHRRAPDRRHARPQRPAAFALHRHRRRPRHHGLGVRLPAVPEEKVVKKWRLQPGKMFLVDLEKGRIVDDKELKDSLASARPYAEWIERIRVKLDEVESEKTPPLKSQVALLDRQQAFAYTQEDLKFIMQPMAANGEEPVGSMGNDSPLAVISNKNKTLYHYFKQLFAQVTNPAIDPIREELVMSLVSFIGPKPEPARHRRAQPAAAPRGVAAGARLLRDGEDPAHRALHLRQVQVLGARHHLPRGLGQGGGRGEPRLARGAGRGRGALGLLDRRHLGPQRRPDRVAIPALWPYRRSTSTSVGKGLRTSTGLVVETGSAREVHHFALLGGYGAEAVHPILRWRRFFRTRATRPRRSRTTSRRSARA
jgi:glutamate synthase domain-containing protein 1